MIKGLAGLAYSVNRPDLAAAIMLGFVGLLRTSEIVNVRFPDLRWLHNGQQAVLMLPFF